MDALIPILVVIFMISSLAKAAKRAGGAQRSGASGAAGASGTANASARPRKTEKPHAPAAPKTFRPAQPENLRAAEAPRMAPRYDDTRMTLATPFGEEDAPSGSMGFESGEGVDPCHDAQLAEPSPGMPSFAAAGGTQARVLPLPLTRDALVQAVVMSEILTRPQDRARRHGGMYGHA